MERMDSLTPCEPQAASPKAPQRHVINRDWVSASPLSMRGILPGPPEPAMNGLFTPLRHRRNGLAKPACDFLASAMAGTETR
jgi:hypothetical protein